MIEPTGRTCFGQTMAAVNGGFDMAKIARPNARVFGFDFETKLLAKLEQILKAETVTEPDNVLGSPGFREK
jgi:hypothetical protein